MKAVGEADNGHFFYKLIKDNIAFTVFVEFFINFWTFPFIVEIVFIPVSFIISFIYAISAEDKQYQPAKRFLNGMFMMSGIALFSNAVYCLIHSSEQFFNSDTVVSFVLPFVLLVFYRESFLIS